MMDLFPVDTNIAACSHPFVERELAVAGRVFVVPFEVVCDRFEVSARLDPFLMALHCSDHLTNAWVAVSDPMVPSIELMEDLNL
jgi:hypothetical protein